MISIQQIQYFYKVLLIDFNNFSPVYHRKCKLKQIYSRYSIGNVNFQHITIFFKYKDEYIFEFTETSSSCSRIIRYQICKPIIIINSLIIFNKFVFTYLIFISSIKKLIVIKLS